MAGQRITIIDLKQFTFKKKGLSNRKVATFPGVNLKTVDVTSTGSKNCHGLRGVTDLGQHGFGGAFTESSPREQGRYEQLSWWFNHIALEMKMLLSLKVAR